MDPPKSMSIKGKKLKNHKLNRLLIMSISIILHTSCGKNVRRRSTATKVHAITKLMKENVCSDHIHSFTFLPLSEIRMGNEMTFLKPVDINVCT